VSIKHGMGNGLLIAWLTWSFFVLCTPIADAGFLIDFPLRLILGLRMIISEIFVWLIAIIVNLFSFLLVPEIYEKTKILSLFEHIIIKPFPFWIIIIISGIGTFLSVKFGDELMDIIKHKDSKYRKKHILKWRLVLVLFMFILILIAYDFFLKELGVNIP
jgi:hypothetical protein